MRISKKEVNLADIDRAEELVDFREVDLSRSGVIAEEVPSIGILANSDSMVSSRNGNTGKAINFAIQCDSLAEQETRFRHILERIQYDDVRGFHNSALKSSITAVGVLHYRRVDSSLNWSRKARNEHTSGSRVDLAELLTANSTRRLWPDSVDLCRNTTKPDERVNSFLDGTHIVIQSVRDQSRITSEDVHHEGRVVSSIDYLRSGTRATNLRGERNSHHLQGSSEKARICERKANTGRSHG